MAAGNLIERGFCGFELGSFGAIRTSSSFGAVVCDGSARSGKYYLKSRTAAGIANVAMSMETVSIGTASIGSSLLDGESCKGMLRVWVRLKSYPSANGVGICGFNASSSDNFPACAAMNTDGTFHARALSSASANSSAVLALNTWYIFEVTSVVTNQNAGNDTTDVTVSVYDSAGTLIETKTVTRSSAPFGTSFARPALGNGTATTAATDVDFDDAEWCVGDGTQAANVSLSTSKLNRIHRVAPSAQGASAAWSNDWRGVAEAPLDRSNTTNLAAANNEQTVTTNGASTTFAHESAAALGLSGILGVKAYAYLKASGGAGTDALLINGAEFSVSTPATYATSSAAHMATDFTPYTDVAFDAMEFGARNKRGVSIQLGAIMLEVLHAGSGPAELPQPASWRHAIITWTGDGSWRDIAGVGFAPDMILVKKIDDTPTSGGAFWVRQLGGTFSRVINETPTASGSADCAQAIKGATADGFSLGPHAAVNASGETYVALCIADGGQHDSGAFAISGVWVGTGVDGSNVVVQNGWQPTAVMLLGTSMIYRDTNYSGDLSWQGGSNVEVANFIQGFNANGFEAGTGEFTNYVMYPYLAIKEDTPIATFFAHGSLLNPGIPFTVTGMAFPPAFVVGGRTGSSLHRFRGPAAVHTGSNSSPWFGGAVGVNGFTALTADGWTGGSDVVANPSVTHWFAFSAAGEIVILPDTEFEFTEDQSGNTIGLSWIETYHADAAGDPKTFLDAPVDLNDPPNYYGGYKSPTIIGMGEITRALSDSRGQSEASEFTWVRSDTDRQIRGWLGTIAQRFIINRMVIARMIDDASRRLLMMPRVIFRGIVRGYKPRGPLHFEFRAQDFLTSLLGSGNLEKQIPQERISRAVFPDAPSDAINRPVPIMYGNLTDGVSGTSIPQPTGTPSRGAYNFGGQWYAGFGDLTSSAAIPAGLSASAVATSAPSTPGGLSASVVGPTGSRTVRYAVSAANAGGESAKSSDVVVNNAPNVLTASNYVQLNWSASGGATSYVVYGRDSTGTYLDHMTGGELSYRDDGDDIQKNGTPVTVGISADVPNGEYGVIVSAVDASNRETDPSPFYYNGPGEGQGSFSNGPITPIVVTGSEKISVSWSAAAGASKYRVYLGYYYYGFVVTQYLEVNAPTVSCEFTKNPPWQTPVSPSNITPGALMPAFNQSWRYAVTAVVADGETGLSQEVVASVLPYRREARIEWLPVSGAMTYRVYRRSSTGTWDRRWEVSAAQNFFDDDMLDTAVTIVDGAPAPQGSVTARWVGTETDAAGGSWYAFLVCGHQVDEIIDVFQSKVRVDPSNFGVNFLVPGETGYGTFFPTHAGTPQYKEVNGRRYTMIYIRGPQGEAAANGSQPITINLRGRRDGGGVAITQIADIYKDFVINFGFQDSGGTYLSAPMWEEDLSGTTAPQVDEASFDTVKAVHLSRLPNGYPGGIVFGSNDEFQTLRDCCALLNISGDMQSGFNRNSQFFVSIFNEAVAALESAKAYTQVHDIVRESFEMDARTDLVENRVVYSYKRRYAPLEGAADWVADRQSVEDEIAQEDLREERESEVLYLHAVRDSATAHDIAARRLLYYKEPPLDVQLLTNLRGLSSELGDVITVSHIEGTGSSGWSLRPLRVMRHITSPSKYSVKLVCVDVERLFAGAFILGDEITLSGLWSTATEQNRRYGYLCDETTGLFSTGHTGKRLR